MKTNEVIEKIDKVFATTDFKGDFERYTFLEQPDIGRDFNFEEKCHIIEKYIENEDKISERQLTVKMVSFYEDCKWDGMRDEMLKRFGDLFDKEGKYFKMYVWFKLRTDEHELYFKYLEEEALHGLEAAEKFKQYCIMKNYEQYI